MATAFISAVAVKTTTFHDEVLVLLIDSIYPAVFEVSVLRSGAFLVALANFDLLPGIAHDVVASMVAEYALVDLILLVPIVIRRSEDEQICLRPVYDYFEL